MAKTAIVSRAPPPISHISRGDDPPYPPLVRPARLTGKAWPTPGPRTRLAWARYDCIVSGVGAAGLGGSCTGRSTLSCCGGCRRSGRTAPRSGSSGRRATCRGLPSRCAGAAAARPVLRVRALGLDFPGPLGLAAGFDKDGEGVTGLAALGFSFIEVGTVTARPQPGNPRPRMFRFPQERALVNRMGFNNDGAAALSARLRALRARPGFRPVIGVNIGKTKAVAEADAVPTTSPAPGWSPTSPTTWSSMSARPTPPDCGTSSRRKSSAHPGRRPRRARRRLPPPPRTAARQDRPRPRRPRHRRGCGPGARTRARRHHRHQHDDLPRGPGRQRGGGRRRPWRHVGRAAQGALP